jgi:Alpha galactosidase A/Alpha galactosidase C-terminal beta sandwich domain
MGWSSWNSFSNTVDSAIVVDQASAIVSSGLKARGYDYVNIDEGWWLGRRDQEGNIIVDPKQWPALEPNEKPGDISNITRYLHGLGLKAGIYTDVGTGGCSTWWPDLGPPVPNTGSEGHYDQDFLQFAKWGFDFVKVDWCGGFQEKLDPKTQYAQIALSIQRAEAATGHHLFYSICDWDNNDAWTWAPGIGGVKAAMWRTSGDIVLPVVAKSPNSERIADFSKVLSNFDKGIHPEAEHTGYINDPDMLVVGMRGMTELQNQVEMSLWSISGAPLLIGADITQLNTDALSTLMNSEVIAIDQDTLGLQGIKIPETNPALEVIAKRLAGDGRRAVVLFNKSTSPAQMSVAWTELGLEPSSPAKVRDVWSHEERGTYTSSFTATVPASAVLMIVLTGTDGRAARYRSTSQADKSSRAFGFSGVNSAGGFSAIQVTYTNRTREAHIVDLAVNGQFTTRIAFPRTGSVKKEGLITIEVPLSSSANGNTLQFTDSSGEPITLGAIRVLAGQL